MYICICNAITDREIRQVVDLGANSLQAVSSALGVGTCCGKCKPEACRVIHEHQLACAGAD